jgi:hypothetical protein
MRFWAIQLWILAVWEALAVGTRRLPTITETSRHLSRKRLARLAVILWATALTDHLLEAGE